MREPRNLYYDQEGVQRGVGDSEALRGRDGGAHGSEMLGGGGAGDEQRVQVVQSGVDSSGEGGCSGEGGDGGDGGDTEER